MTRNARIRRDVVGEAPATAREGACAPRESAEKSESPYVDSHVKAERRVGARGLQGCESVVA
jgi:hypothetical protein